MEAVRIRSGWVTFVAIIAGVVGVFNILTGIAAIAEDDQTEALHEVLFGVNITAWGWFWLILGVLQFITAWLIYQRSAVGQTLGLIWAFVDGVALGVHDLRRSDLGARRHGSQRHRDLGADGVPRGLRRSLR